ncbi:hypothetical protein HPP92_015378 [Vanilla planifolia]|uniref:Glabrous enhancer-binding protein-like DBD domain-containing protein n=1 Tax=Vanilla planifolia TaxID=51239 RepID=A0A835QXM9_VANPL|nr:hypothetical protein HPP92_015378 [Vanilla planifolia]
MACDAENDPSAAGGGDVNDGGESGRGGLGDRKRPRALDSFVGEESRRMFQKLWTDADEMMVLQGFLDFTSRRGTTHANYQHDTGPFFDEILPRLQFAFNKNQIVEKLRRLKRKYRNASARIGSGRGFVFKSPHDHAAYEISRKIWSSTVKRKSKNMTPDAVQTLLDQRGGGGRSCGSEEALVPVVVVESSTGAAAEASVPPAPQTEAEAAVPSATIAAPGVEEEAVRICLAPMFKELVKFVTSGATMVAEPPASVMPAERYERWRRHRIMELELHLKRVNLVEEFVRSALEKLRSLGS